MDNVTIVELSGFQHSIKFFGVKCQKRDINQSVAMIVIDGPMGINISSASHQSVVKSPPSDHSLSTLSMSPAANSVIQ